MTFNPGVFFDACRHGIMGPTLDQGEVDGANAILEAMQGTPRSWCAYALATAWHETAHSMQPIHEMGGPNYFFRMYDIGGNRPSLAKANGNTQPGDGAKYAGRGYVQLTWRNNYRRAGQELGEPLEDQPELAMLPAIAAKIMRKGMEEGWFTGRKLATYLPTNGNALTSAFVNARRIINGTDRAQDIANYAVAFQSALEKAAWA